MIKPNKSLNSTRLGFGRKSYSDLLASLVLSTTFFFFAPVSVYFENATRLNLNLWHVLYYYALLSSAVFVVLASFISLTRKFFTDVAVIYVAISYSYFIQGTLLVYKLGNLDGHVIRWEAYRGYLWVEFIFWGGAILAATFYRKRLVSQLFYMIPLLVFLEVSILVGSSIANKALADSKINNMALSVNYDREFEFSSDKNVVIIVLDTFRLPAFYDSLEMSPDLRVVFKDFTLFDNTVSNFPNTYASIPAMLTGKPYDNQKTTPDFLNSVFAQSLPVLLDQHEFDVELYPLNSTSLTSYPNVWNNVDRSPSVFKTPFRSLFYLTKRLSLLSLIRYSPLVLKPAFVQMFYDISEEDMQELSEFQNSAKVFYENSNLIKKTDRTSVFKFIHLPGVHPPFTINSSFAHGEYPFGYGSYLDQAVANLIAVSNFIDNLKKAGVYNNTFIIITGDHGIQPFSEEYAGSKITIKNRPFFVHNFLPDLARPLLLVKNFKEIQEGTIVSNKPVILSDFPRMVSESLNLKNDFGGFNPLKTLIPPNRKRYFYFYDSALHTWGDSYMPPLFEYSIQGPADDVRSWAFTGKVYNPGRIDLFSRPIYEYGSNFLASALFHQYTRFISDGYYFDNDLNLWSLRPISCIDMPVEKEKVALFLSLSITPFANKGMALDQEISITADNQWIKDIRLNDGSNLITVLLPPNLSEDGELHICFEYSKTGGLPTGHILDEASARLGGTFQSISVDKFSAFSMPAKFDFGMKGNSDSVKSAGWSISETEYTWTNGRKAELSIPLKLGDAESMKLTAFALPFLDGKRLTQQSIIVRSNRDELGHWIMDRAGEYSVIIPRKYVKNGFLNIEFEIKDAASPLRLGMSSDARSLGMAVHWMRVSEVVASALPVEYDFGSAGSSDAVKSNGWSFSEPEYTWTAGPKAELSLPLAHIDSENLTLRVSAVPFIAGAGPTEQDVIVRSGGVELGRWAMDHDGEYSLSIPAKYVKNGFLNLEFELPNAVSPLSLGLSQDARMLGMAVRWLRLSQ